MQCKHSPSLRQKQKYRADCKEEGILLFLVDRAAIINPRITAVFFHPDFVNILQCIEPENIALLPDGNRQIPVADQNGSVLTAPWQTFCQFQDKIRDCFLRISAICHAKCIKLLRNASFFSIDFDFYSRNMQPPLTASLRTAQFPAHSAKYKQFLYKCLYILRQFSLLLFWDLIICGHPVCQCFHRLRLFQHFP